MIIYNGPGPYKLTPSTHERFRSILKDQIHFYRKGDTSYVRVNNPRLVFGHSYICKLLLTKLTLDDPLYKNRYFQFLLNPALFLLELNDQDLPPCLQEINKLRYYMWSIVRLTDKYLISDILVNNTKLKIKQTIEDDLTGWFKFRYQFDNHDTVLNDYCSFVKTLHKINAKHGTIKYSMDYDSIIKNLNAVEKAERAANKIKKELKEQQQQAIDEKTSEGSVYDFIVSLPNEKPNNRSKKK